MKALTVTCLMMFCLLPVMARGVHAESLTISAGKALLHQKNKSYPLIVHALDSGLISCKEYVEEANRANAAFKACMNPDSPPTGSPVARFNTYTSKPLGKFCDNLTALQCVDKVHGQQISYCQQAASPSNDKAYRQKALCTGQTGNQPHDDIKSIVKRLTEEKAALNERKKKLESEITTINAEIAAKDAKINEVTRETGK